MAPRHLLRLGTGEADLRREQVVPLSGDAGSSGEIFSKQGRVNWSLARRLKLLSAVSKLGASLGDIPSLIIVIVITIFNVHVITNGSSLLLIIYFIFY